MSKQYKIEKVCSGGYVLYVGENPSCNKWLVFVATWVVTLLFAGLPLIFFLAEKDIRHNWLFPKTEWDTYSRNAYNNLEDAIKVVEKLKECEKEVYYL